MPFSDDFQTNAILSIVKGLPKWTYAIQLVSEYIATGTAGASSREHVAIDEEPLSNLVAVDIEVGAIVNQSCVGGCLILTGTAITNATIADATGIAGQRFCIPIPPYHGPSTNATVGVPVARRIILPEAVTIGTSITGWHAYLVANTAGTTPIACTVTLYCDRSDKTYPTTPCGQALVSQPDV